jgi:hypothetical protein
MKISSCPTSTCRYCYHYQPEGHRGGTCHQLSVPVQGTWKSCPLGQPAFAGNQEMLAQNIVQLEHALGLEYLIDRSAVEASQAVEIEARR